MTPPKGYARLEGRLSLLAWLHCQLGYTDTQGLLSNNKQWNEGFREDGRSPICLALESRSDKMQALTIGDLQKYDDNIRKHLAAMNDGRPQPITLRYFQYLATLYTEIYLDWRFNRPAALLDSLNKFVSKHNANCAPGQGYELFTPNDLTKLAFWMATGSGKTLLLHLHYRQFMHYNNKPLDNILLITPNEGLSQQHLDELQASNIAAARFDLNEPGSLLGQPGTVKVTEITKLVEEKRGGGVRVPVETFEGNNLIFVDEGHKGAGGETWRGMRDALAETGFTFEYSATFGQALAAANNDALLTEYGKAIAFDYSYRHFYGDGYGKDFNILNLQEETGDDRTNTLLMANLLSFYEQQLVFAETKERLRPYGLEKPLWVFVGSSVNAPKKDSDLLRSDILTVVRFLHRVLSDPVGSVAVIENLLKGESGLTSPTDGKDLFAGKFDYLRHRFPGSFESVYWDALTRVMHANGGGLELSDLRGSEGELGLKANGAEDYFGVVYVGDTAAFKRLVESDNSAIVVAEDALQGSLFDRINEPDSPVQVLAGARKFIEGWNSWRVSNMGLLNIGRSEGSQIIQLFGRGVRLRGRDMTLKRSSALNDGPHPQHIRLLENLNIFALRANYMAQFREYLEDEGIDTHDPVEMLLPICPNTEFLDKGLVIPRLDQGKHFTEQETVLLQYDDEVKPAHVDMRAHVQQLASVPEGVAATVAASGSQREIPTKSLDLVDWNSAYLELLEYKETKGLGNLLIRPELLRPILEAGDKAYVLEADEHVFEPTTHDHRIRLQEAVANILRSYADRLYRRRQAQWESKNMTYRQLDLFDGNLRFNAIKDGAAGQYIVRVPANREDLVEAINQLIMDCNTLYRKDKGDLPRVHFDRHLYQPLLVKGDGITSSPSGLEKSECQFVADLKDYCANASDALQAGAELFLLRNQTRGRGVGFFESQYFFPDFILWIKNQDGQRIVFVEPHGMLHENAYVYDERAQLYERLPGLAAKIAARSDIQNVELDSFIVSATDYDVLKKKQYGGWTIEDFAGKHILFRDPGGGYGYVEQILRA